MNEEIETIIKTLERRFTSGNSNPIESARIKREEFDEIKAFIEGYKQICD